MNDDAIKQAANGIVGIVRDAKLTDEQARYVLTEAAKRAKGDGMKLPEGFRRLRFSEFLAISPGYVENVAKAFPQLTIESVAQALERMSDAVPAVRAPLLMFAVSPNAEPAVFMAQDSDFDRVPMEGHKAIAEAAIGVFERGGNFDTRTGKIEGTFGEESVQGETVSVDQWIASTSADLARLHADVRLSKTVLFSILRRFESAGYLKLFQVSDGTIVRLTIPHVSDVSNSERAVAAAIMRLFNVEKQRNPNAKYKFDDNSRLTPEEVLGGSKPGQHTYARAIAMQYAALEDLRKAGAAMVRSGRTSVHGMSYNELFGVDIAGLSRADTYCWFKDPIDAVEAAAASLPSSVRLTKDLAEGAAGWWWFVRPLDAATVDGSEQVCALLWSWGDIDVQRTQDFATPFFVGKGKHFGLMFSAYVFDPKGRTNAPTPTTKFFWKEGTTLDHHIQDLAQRYDARYSDEKRAKLLADDPNLLFGRDATLAAMERLTRFFVAGALWMKQRILVQTPGHIERHERKRMERSGAFQRPLTDIQIIQLRRRDVVTTAPDEQGTKTVDWKCRWIVSGHWRDQYYPSKGKYEPKWIGSYDKGPEGLPLKVPTHRVYTVNR